MSFPFQTLATLFSSTLCRYMCQIYIWFMERNSGWLLTDKQCLFNRSFLFPYMQAWSDRGYLVRSQSPASLRSTTPECSREHNVLWWYYDMLILLRESGETTSHIDIQNETWYTIICMINGVTQLSTFNTRDWRISHIFSVHCTMKLHVTTDVA